MLAHTPINKMTFLEVKLYKAKWGKGGNTPFLPLRIIITGG